MKHHSRSKKQKMNQQNNSVAVQLQAQPPLFDNIKFGVDQLDAGQKVHAGQESDTYRDSYKNQEIRDPKETHEQERNKRDVSVASELAVCSDFDAEADTEVDAGPERFQPFPVHIIRSERRVKTVSARLVDGVLQVRAPARMDQDELDDILTDITRRIEKKHRCSDISLADRASKLAIKYGLPEPKSIRWSSKQNFRWGSCTPSQATVRISDRLIDVPPWVLDHVIIHELAHLVYANHSPEFYELVNRNPKAERAEGYLLAFSYFKSIGDD